MKSQKDKFKQITGNKTVATENEPKKRTWRDYMKWPSMSSNHNSNDDSNSSGENNKNASISE